jgi:hypothetical protein
MRVVCCPPDPNATAESSESDSLHVVLYARQNVSERGSAGAAIVEELRRHKLAPCPRAWDFLSIALAVTAADLAGHRDKSSDGWTREFDLSIPVSDPEFWATQTPTLEALLRFLTTDRWRVSFVPGATYPKPPASIYSPEHDSVVLLSGGLDSFTGALNLVAAGHNPFAVSQSVRGDAEKQRRLSAIVGTTGHLQLNHNTLVPNPENPPTQRARSVGFFAYGVMAATTLRTYADGGTIPLFVCENGFISLNPPLTGSRLGSLSTRTCHPVVLTLLQRIMDAAGLRVRFENPYARNTKGEMLVGSSRQEELREHAHETTSCGRFKRFGYRHCGRCVPCLIRRAAFHAWNVPDQTTYVHPDLSIDDLEHARSDDVRATAMAVAEVSSLGLDEWLSVALSSPFLNGNATHLRDVISRGLTELDRFLQTFHIK